MSSLVVALYSHISLVIKLFEMVNNEV